MRGLSTAVRCKTRFFCEVKRRMEQPIYVTRPSMPPFDEYCREIKDLWDSRFLTNDGVKHKQLEQQLEDYLETPHIQLFPNGHTALELAIKALDLSGEVITTPFTFISTTQAIIRNGLTPVFCDIEDKYYTIDVGKIESLITEKTSAIIPVHVYGNVCDHKAIKKIADKYGLKVIYDAAHAFGESVDGVNVSNLGDISMFSFHATKVYNTIEGGALSFSDEALDEKLAALRKFGLKGEEDTGIIGTNAKMTEFAASMGICNLRHIDEYILKRERAFNRYRERLSGVKGIVLCPEQDNVKHNYAYFPVVFEKDVFGAGRDEAAAKLASENIFARKYFYPLTSQFKAVKKLCRTNETPTASRIADNVLALPLYSDLTLEDVDRICDIILS